MKLTMDKAGRVVIPKALRERLGMLDGGTFDASQYGSGIQLVPQQGFAKLVEDDDGYLVVETETPVTDEMVFALVDELRK